MFIANVGQKLAPEWLVNMKGQIGRKAYWKQGFYEVTGVRNGCYLLAQSRMSPFHVAALPEEVKVL